ncbi:MAG: RNA 2',3'-cyclic phosphodiesterase [Nanoarchaeota archaeon]
MRVFISIPLSKEAIEEIKRIQNKISERKLFEGKMTESENLHLTLKFLGEVDEEQLNRIKEKLREIRADKFRVKLGKTGVFSEDFVRIIWIKLDGKEIFELQKKIDECLKEHFKQEFRFMGHVTISRVKSVKDKKALLQFLKEVKIKNVEFEVKSFNLMKSELFLEGPTYEVIEEFDMNS